MITYEVRFLEFDHYGKIIHREALGKFGVEGGKVVGMAERLEDYIKKGDTINAALRHFPGPYYQVVQIDQEQV